VNRRPGRGRPGDPRVLTIDFLNSIPDDLHIVFDHFVSQRFLPLSRASRRPDGLFILTIDRADGDRRLREMARLGKKKSPSGRRTSCGSRVPTRISTALKRGKPRSWSLTTTPKRKAATFAAAKSGRRSSCWFLIFIPAGIDHVFL
jgi:hypothetical protein